MKGEYGTLFEQSPWGHDTGDIDDRQDRNRARLRDLLRSPSGFGAGPVVSFADVPHALCAAS